MVLNKFTGSTQMDGTEKPLYKIVGTTMKHFMAYTYLKALQAGESLRLRVYNKVDDVSHWKFDNTVTDSVNSNDGTITNISSFQDWLKFDANVTETVGANTWTTNYHASLKALYKFDNTINDSTSGAHNLTLASGTTTYATGREGQAVSFDALTSYTANSAVVVTGTGDRTVTFWVKTPSTFTAKAIFTWGTNVANQGFGAQWTSTASTSTLIYIGFSNDVVSNTVFQPNTWYHIALTVGTTGTVRKIYVNGILDISSTTTALNTASSSLFIGDFAWATGNYLTSGTLIDEFRIYSIQLDSSQVISLYMNGHANQCHTFDAGENITTTYSPTSLTSGDFSISFWHKTPDNTTVVENDNSKIFADNSGNFFIRIRPRAEAFNTIEMFLNKSGGILFDRISNTYVPDIWHHEVYVWDNTAKTISQYEDGVFKSSVSVGATLSAISNPVRIGNNGSVAYCGQLDDFRIFSSKLSASQISDLYNYTGSNYISPLPAGNSLYFDGSTYVSVTNTAPYNFERTNAFSISAWINTVSNTLAIVTKNNGTGTKGYEVTLNASGKVQIRIVNTASTNEINVVDSGAAVNDGSPHNIIVTYAGTSAASGVALYVDGVARSLSTTTNNLSATIQNTNNVTIGAQGNATQKFTDLIDEVQIWNYVITLQEIAQVFAGRFANYHNIGYWKFDGDLYDYSGHGSSGILTGTATYAIGALSGSYTTPNTNLNFDGSQYVVVTSNANIPIGLSDRTISFWMYPTNFTNNNWLFAHGTNTNHNLFGMFCTSTASTSTFTFDDGNLANTLATTTVFKLNTWYHVAVVISGGEGKTVTIYVNGVQDATNTFTVSMNTIASNFFIGAFLGGTNTFSGRLDDLRLYNRALSSAEVSDLYTYPDSAMKSLVYDKTYTGVVSDTKYIVPLQGNQMMVTAQQLNGTNRIITWEREEVS